MTINFFHCENNVDEIFQLINFCKRILPSSTDSLSLQCQIQASHP